MPFKLTGYCRLRSKENSSQEGDEYNIYGFTAPNGSSQQRRTRLQDISARISNLLPARASEQGNVIGSVCIIYMCVQKKL